MVPLVSVLAVIYILVVLLVVINLINDLPQLGKELSVKLEKAYEFINSKFNLSWEQQLDYIWNELALSVQLTKSYFLTPNMTGSKVRLNPYSLLWVC